MSDNRFGIKEVADVWFYRLNEDGTKGEPVLCLDTLKVSNIEQSADSVDAKGGKGDAPLIIWDYNKEINITLEDALLSEASLEMVYGKDEDGTITISANTFPGVYYVIGRTFARDMKTGKDRLFSFVIPKAKIMSENTIAMEAEGDPTVFNMNLRALRDKDGKMVKLIMGISEESLSFQADDEDDRITKVMGVDSTALDNYKNIEFDVTIPSKYNGTYVYEIDDAAFVGDGFIFNSFEISDGIHTIGEEAFSYSNITELKIPKSVGYIRSNPCSHCPNLILLQVDSENDTYYSENSNCIIHKSAQRVIAGCKTSEIPYGTKSIDENAFDGCTSLTSIAIPNSVTSIGDSAFSSCDSLTGIVIPDSVTSIGENAFYGCTGLASITIPDSVISIGDRAFSRCSNLTELLVEEENPIYHSAGNCIIQTDSKTLKVGCNTSQIPTDGSVISIGDSAFYGCTGLISVIIPDSATSIGAATFYNCTSLTSIAIPNSVTSIGKRAFALCSKLTGIVIPDSVTSISDSVFKECTSLTSITIPNSVTSIDEQAFYDCTSLTSVTIGTNVSSIDFYAFRGCTGLTDIYLPGHAKGSIKNAPWSAPNATLHWNEEAPK